MRIVYFTHSLQSCWNNGSAHFLRGLLRELTNLGHDVRVFEPAGGWSLDNLMRDHGTSALRAFKSAYPELASTTYRPDTDVERLVDGADLVIVHEWNEPSLVRALSNLRRRGSSFILLFHDTHHRAVSEPQVMRALDLDGFDGVLAFGEALAEIYRGWGWGARAFVLHEGADVRLFKPLQAEDERQGLVWVGNWGDGARIRELEEFVLTPSKAAGFSLDAYGVRYPAEAIELLTKFGVVYKGWLANARAPEVFARYMATVHVPRRFYVDQLQGIPTIRVFETLACGLPLINTQWTDTEGLFRTGVDFLEAQTGAEVAKHLRDIRNDAELRLSLARCGRETILSRHTCAHRAHELLNIVEGLARVACPLAASA